MKVFIKALISFFCALYLVVSTPVLIFYGILASTIIQDFLNGPPDCFDRFMQSICNQGILELVSWLVLADCVALIILGYMIKKLFFN